jgi:hypothetical protein
MSTRGVQTGQGYKFGGAKAKAIKARLRAMKEEREQIDEGVMLPPMEVRGCRAALGEWLSNWPRGGVDQGASGSAGTLP